MGQCRLACWVPVGRAVCSTGAAGSRDGREGRQEDAPWPQVTAQDAQTQTTPTPNPHPVPPSQVFDDWKAASDAWMGAQQQHKPNSDLLEETTAAPAAAAAASGSAGGGAEAAASRLQRGQAQQWGQAQQGPPPQAQQGQQQAQQGQQPQQAQQGRLYPKLSPVTLAFLEACCRREPEVEWRVYDVCAQMRQQKEHKRQAGLARPAKASHHFAPA